MVRWLQFRQYFYPEYTSSSVELARSDRMELFFEAEESCGYIRAGAVVQLERRSPQTTGEYCFTTSPSLRDSREKLFYLFPVLEMLDLLLTPE